MRSKWRVIAAAAAAMTLSAHVVWVETEAPVLEVGKPAVIRIGNGHDIAASDSAIPTAGVEFWAVTPKGRTALQPAVSGAWVSAGFTPPSAGVYRFVMTQDRGVISSTPKGYLPGGRDKHPDSPRSIKLWRSASAVGLTQGAKLTALKPLGLVFELVGERKGDAMHLLVLRNGKPQADAEIAVGFPGKKEQDKVGKTGPDGRFLFKTPAGTSGPIVFAASLVEPAPKGSHYDTNNLSSSLYLRW